MGTIVLIPAFVVKEIQISVRKGYTELVEGMISRHRKGVLLVNKDYEVRGTYDLSLKAIIQDIINETTP